jgi:hypothetical protein
MDVTCTAITLIYLMICFLPFICNSFISFLSPLPLNFSFFFLPFSFYYSPRHATPIVFLLPILEPFLLLHILRAFSLYLPSDPPFHVIWLCLSSFSVVVQYLIDKLVRLSCYLLILKFSFLLFHLYSFYAWSSVCTVGEVASRSRRCFLSRLTEDRCRRPLSCMQ